jgi:opacity protein-like surface antigen
VALLRYCKSAGKLAIPLISGLSFWFLTFDSAFVHAETTFIPTIAVSERYDTNIWMAPAEFLPPGTRLDDFATTLAGGIQTLYKERDIEASLNVGGDFNAYVYNPGLNFFTARLEGYAQLDGWVQRLVKGAHLRVADNFRYTPETPGFVTGVKGAVVEDPFLRGLQSFRANTYSNTASINGSVPVFRDLALDARYSFSIYRVGSVLAASATGASFFDTTVHSWSAGPRYILTREDSVAVLYQRSQFTQTTIGTSLPFDFTTQTLLLDYTRTTPDWKFGIQGGATHLDPADRAYPTATISVSNSLERVTTVRLDLSRKAAPSFFFVGGAMISNVGTIAVSHKLSRLLTLQGSVNYGFNETVPDRKVKFTNLTAGAGLNYKLTKTMALDLYYTYNDFKTDQTALSFEVIRNLVGFSLTAQWK